MSVISSKAVQLIENPIGVSFLLCTYNGATRITETLACLARQHTTAYSRWEIILVDNASTDNTAELAQIAWAKLDSPAPLYLLHEARPGKQYALETAIDQVHYRYTCIVDDDNRLAEDYMRIGLAILEAYPQIGILGGPTTATFEGAEPAWFDSFQHCYAVGPQLDRVDGNLTPLIDGNVGRNVLWGAGMFVRTAVWYKLRAAGFKSLFAGRQETNLVGGEDDELCYATQLLGYEVWYSSQLHLQHYMVAGRLTIAYRNRLFYDSARTAARLNAYRNALWGKQNDTTKTNFIKDAGYLILGSVKEVFSLAFVQSYFNGKYLVRMQLHHGLLSIKDVLLQGQWGQAHYKPVISFKQKLVANKCAE